MLGPAADSMSYYVNSFSSRGISVHWLRWCWQSYLGTNPLGEKVPERTVQLKNVEQRLREGSNYTLWKNCKWNKDVLKRLVDPSAADLPKNLNDHAMQFFIITNRADPLCDGGNRMASCLKKAGAKVTLYEHNGCHVFGSLFEKESNKKRMEAWLNAIYE